VGDTANWEFAAAVAAVCIGLGGLLLFTLIGVLGAWRVYGGAARAASEAAKAAASVRELAIALTASRQLIEPATQRAPETDFAAASDELDDIRKRTADLLAQQTLLQDAVRNLVEAGVLQGEESGEQLRALEQTLRRVEEHLIRITTPGAR
jgi:hypothetical protein